MPKPKLPSLQAKRAYVQKVARELGLRMALHEVVKTVEETDPKEGLSVTRKKKVLGLVILPQ